MGLRSYGICLWHWPVFMVTRPQLDVAMEGLPLLVLRLGVTVLLADLSYRYVETPIRRGAIGRAWRTLRTARGFKRWALGARWVGAVVPAVTLCAALGVAVAHAKPPDAPSYISTRKVHIEASDKAPSNAGTSPAAGTSAVGTKQATPAVGASEQKTQARAHKTTAESPSEAAVTGSPTKTSTGTLTAIGDSVMLGAVDALQQEIPNLTIIDARGSRQPPEAIEVARGLRAAGKLGDVVIVHIGNNGVFTDEHFDEMMDVLGSARKVLIVNVTIPDGYSWVPNNGVLADGVRRYPGKAVLVDWYTASAGHPEYFWDGIHLTPQGAQAHADLIAAACKKNRC